MSESIYHMMDRLHNDLVKYYGGENELMQAKRVQVMLRLTARVLGLSDAFKTPAAAMKALNEVGA